MSGKRRRDQSAEEIRRVAAEHGAEVVGEGVSGSCHRYITVSKNGLTRKLFFGNSPGDHRAHLNMRTLARQVIRAM